jgi:hypothetical protein
MSFETPPIERVQARPIRLALVVAGLVAATGILVWQPWSAGPAVPGATPSTRVGAGTTNVAAAPSATPVASPTPYAAPRGLNVLRESPDLRLPTADRFRPRWSAVGVAQLPDPQIRITQLPMVPTSGHVEGRSATEVCEIGRLGSAMVALLPADELLLIGIAAPAGALPGPIEVTQIDAPPLAALEAQLPSIPDPDEAVASARLFVRADLLPWPEGVYSFLTESNDGMPHWLYACLVDPTIVDGTG